MARFLFATAGRELRSRLRDPLALLLWVAIPALIGGLLSSFGEGDAAPQATLLVADRDHSLLSGLVAGSRDWGGLVVTEAVVEPEGRRRMDAGEASALLVLPVGFQRAILLDQPARLELLTNPAQRVLPGVVRESLEILLEAVFYGQRLIGDPIRAAAHDAPDGPGVESLAAALEELSAGEARVRPLLSPLAFQLETRIEGRDSTPGFGALFLPGLLMMGLLFSAQGVSDELWREKEQGTLARLASSPQPLGSVLAGRLLAAAVVIGAVSSAGLVTGLLAFELEPARLPLALAWCVLSGTALVPWLTLIQLYASSARGGNLLTGVLVFPLMMIGGSFFPFEAMPAWMAELGRWTPNGLAVARLAELLGGRAEPGSLARSALAQAGPAALAFLLAWRRLPGFARS